MYYPSKCKFLCFSFMAIMLCLTSISSADIAETFNGTVTVDIDLLGATNETPGVSADTGFLYGAFASPTATNRISFNNSGVPGEITFRNKSGQDSYFYTIFDADGAAPFNAEIVQLTGIQVDFRSGRGNDNRFLVRRASDGVWLASPVVTFPAATGVQNYDLSGTWTELDTATNNNLNALSGGDEGALVFFGNNRRFCNIEPKCSNRWRWILYRFY